MPEGQRSGMLAVILGASLFPDSPKLAESRAFYISAADVKDYIGQESGLAIPRRNIVSLFDDSRSPADQLTEIAKFLSRRPGELRTEGCEVDALLVYYVGHGLFNRSDQKYCLAVRSTNEINEGATSIRASDLASVIREHAAFVRRYLILDCCFSASIYQEFQSAPLNAVRTQIKYEFPLRGTALLCSSSARDASLAPAGLDHTMFSGALISALRQGHTSCGQKLSFFELGKLVEQILRSEYPENWVRPEVLSPDQREGDIADIPLFPNPAWVKQRQVEQDEAGRLAGEQAERDRLAQVKAVAAKRERLAREQAEWDRSAQVKAAAAERERLAREQAERDRVAQAIAAAAKRERLARDQALVAPTELPPRTVIMAQLLALLQTPAIRLVRLLNEPGSELVRVLDVIVHLRGGARIAL